MNKLELPPVKLLLSSIFHCLVGGCGWYSYTALNPLESFIKRFANETMSLDSESEVAVAWSSITTLFQIGGIIGSLLISFSLDRFGRKLPLLLMKNVVLIVASFMQFAAINCNSPIILILGRFVSGIASSPNLFLPLYVSECSPVKYRGLTSAITSLGLELWDVIGTIMGLPQIFGTQELWQYVILFPAIPAFIHLLGFPFLPESPKYLYATKRDLVMCEQAIKFYHGIDADVEEVMEEYRTEIELGQHEDSLGLFQILKTKHLRWPLFLCVVASMTIAADGSDIAYQYSTEIMMGTFSAKNSALFTVLFAQIPSFFAAVVGTGLVEISGRKILFLVGLALAVLGTVFVLISGLSKNNVGFSVLGILLISVGDFMGPSVVRTFLAGELCPQVSRSTTAGYMFVAEDVGSMMASFYYPPVNQLIGSYAILPFTILAASSFLFLLVFLPETKNKSVEEVVARWMDIEEDEEELLIDDPTQYGTFIEENWL